MNENPDGITNCPPESTNPSSTSTNGTNGTTTLYCCIAKGGKILYRYATNGSDLESLAAQCLDQTPPYHKWYFHTVGTRTFGFLMSDNCTFFAIAEPTMGSNMLHDFLINVREVFASAPKRNLETALAPLMARFVETLEHVQSNGVDILYTDEIFHDKESGVPPGHGKRKKRERKDKKGKRNDEIEMEEIAIVREGERRNGEERGMDGSERNRMRGQLLHARRAVWWWHVKVVALVDAVVCLVLLGVWLVVCQGFKCVR